MARAIWTGTISFGLVSIPVRLYNATAPKDVRFHQFQAGTGRRIRYRRVVEPGGAADSFDAPARWPEWDRADAEAHDADAADPDAQSMEEPGFDDSEAAEPRDEPSPRGEGAPFAPRPAATPPSDARSPWTYPSQVEVPYDEVVKGYEVDRDTYVMLGPEELRALEPEKSQSIEIEDFVSLEEIDPLHFEKSYYIAPLRGVGAEKPYALLLRSMQRAHRVGIARFVLRSKPYLAALRPVEDALVLETLYFADEVRAPKEIDNLPVGAEPSPRELDIAEKLIAMLERPWDPHRYPDTYRERIMELIESKMGGREVVREEPVAPPAAPDLMAALRASVEAARRERTETDPTAGAELESKTTRPAKAPRTRRKTG
jgi:DNA end-binding protein Ku